MSSGTKGYNTPNEQTQILKKSLKRHPSSSTEELMNVSTACASSRAPSNFKSRANASGVAVQRMRLLEPSLKGHASGLRTNKANQQSHFSRKMSAFSSHQPRRDTLHEVKKEKSSLLIDTDRQLVIDRRHTRRAHVRCIHRTSGWHHAFFGVCGWSL